jgi:hypothetical protein
MLWKVLIGIVAAFYVYRAIRRYRFSREMWE